MIFKDKNMTTPTNNPRYSPRRGGAPSHNDGGPRRFEGQRRTHGAGQTRPGISRPKPSGYGRNAQGPLRSHGNETRRPGSPAAPFRGDGRQAMPTSPLRRSFSEASRQAGEFQKTESPHQSKHGTEQATALAGQAAALAGQAAALAGQVKKSVLRIIPLGGLEEVGCNMMIYEYGNDILIIDVGLQFPNEDMPGIDFIIPNIAYLKGKEKNIRGVIITHGHYDHLGAIPYLIEKLGYPTIYTMPLTRGIILKRQEDFKNVKPLDIEIVNHDTILKLGVFKVEFIHLNHNIPDAVGLAIRTPEGILLHATDYKFDPTPVNDKPADVAKIAKLAGEGVLALLSDSTGAETPGRSISEQVVKKNLGEIFEKASGRIILATFSSLLTRIQQVVDLAEKFDKKVAVDGYSMKSNVEIARQLGYLKIKKGTLVPMDEIMKYPLSKTVVVCTGAQGEGSAVLMRIANGEHKFIKIKKGDAVIFSSSVVPGNERTVQDLKDLLARQGAKLYHYKLMDIHSGGHAPAEDLKMMVTMVKPKFFIPIHGNYYLLRLHADLAESVGIPPENIVIPENGQVIELAKEKILLTEERAPSNYIMVDGLGVGDIGEVVLRDRQMISKDGIFVIIVVIDSKTGKIKGSPDIISRGFIYLRESKELLAQTRKKIKEIVAKTSSAEHALNWVYVKDNLRDKVGQFLYSKTERRPMVIPVIIEV